MNLSERPGPKFRVDESVLYSTNSLNRNTPESLERFVVVAVLPRDSSGLHQYRIRPTGPGPQRIATELDLKR